MGNTAVACRKYTRVDQRKDGVVKSSGVHCIRCGQAFRDWGEFFRHHGDMHPRT